MNRKQLKIIANKYRKEIRELEEKGMFKNDKSYEDLWCVLSSKEIDEISRIFFDVAYSENEEEIRWKCSISALNIPNDCENTCSCAVCKVRSLRFFLCEVEYE